MADLRPLEEGEEISEDWISALVTAVNASRVVQGDGSDILSSTREGGTVFRLSGLARYQMVQVIVETQAPAATTVSGNRRSGIGYFYWLLPLAIDDASDPRRFDWGTDPDNTVPVPFFNNYLAGPSSAEGKAIWVAPSPQGWLYVGGEC